VAPCYRVCGQATPDHHVLRIGLRDLVGRLALIRCGRLADSLPGDRAAHRSPYRGPHLPGPGGAARARLADDPLAREVVLVRGGRGLPLAVLLITVGLNGALGAGTPSLAGVGSLSTILMVFAVRLINPLDGPMGEEPGWRGFALPGLQTTLSPLVTTMILAVLITGWHLPTFLLEGFQPSIFVGGVVGTVAVTFWYTWLFNHTGGSVLLVLVAHSIQGTIKIGAPWSASADVAQALLVYAFVASAVAIGLVIFDRKAWRGPAAAETTTPPVIPPREATPVAPA
jgi:hypothetical protein